MKLIEENAKELALAHKETDPKTRMIKFFPGARENEICLLEVTDAVPTTGEVLPVRFSADPENGVDYPMTVILFSPQEWEEYLANHKPDLPEGWDLNSAKELL
jgi:hypothetical protein